MNYSADPKVTLNQIVKIKACITSLNYVLSSLEAEGKPISGLVNQVDNVKAILEKLE